MSEVDIEPNFIKSKRDKSNHAKKHKKGTDPAPPAPTPAPAPAPAPTRAPVSEKKKGFLSVFTENKILLITTAIVIILFIVFIVWTMRKDARPKMGPRPPPK
jgi:hypothetical protein